MAAYKGDRCLFYEEKVQPGSTPFDEDVTCRGSAWAGNVTLKVIDLAVAALGAGRKLTLTLLNLLGWVLRVDAARFCTMCYVLLCQLLGLQEGALGKNQQRHLVRACSLLRGTSICDAINR